MTFCIPNVPRYSGNTGIVDPTRPLAFTFTSAWRTGVKPHGFSNPVIVLSNSMSYFLEGTTIEGCIGYDTIHINVYKGPDIYMPNTFSPNGDGRNELFKPILVGTTELYYFSVYNRWGQLIFSTKQSGRGWDGKFNGAEQPTGTYVWIVKVRDYLNNTIEKKGTILLLR